MPPPPPPFLSVSSDYVNDLGSGDIILTADNSSVTISFTLVDDSFYELTERLSASLSFSGAAIDRVTLDPSLAEVIINDDDGKYIKQMESAT